MSKLRSVKEAGEILRFHCLSSVAIPSSERGTFKIGLGVQWPMLGSEHMTEVESGYPQTLIQTKHVRLPTRRVAGNTPSAGDISELSAIKVMVSEGGCRLP